MTNKATSSAPQLLPLDLGPGERLSLVGPALAATAGAVASGRLAPDAQTVVTLVLAVLLADPLLGGLWLAVTGARWRERWSSASVAPGEVVHLPHAVAGSPAHRLSEALARLGAAGKDEADGGLPFSLTRSAFFLVFSLAVAAALGPAAVLLVVASAALTCLQALLGVYLPGLRWPESLCLFGTAWLIGFAAFGALPVRVEGLAPAALAAAWTVAHFGLRGLVLGDPAARALVALDGGQLLAAVLLVMGGRPWQAGLLILLLAAQALGQPRFWRDRDGVACAAGALPYLVGAVLVTFL